MGVRRLAIASLGGQLAWVLIVTLAGLIEPGYSEIRDPLSALGAETAANPWLFDVAVTIWGTTFIAAALALALDAPRGFRGLLGPALIAFTGLTQILDGFAFPFSCRPTIDPGCRARELAGEVPWQHVAHGLDYFLGAVALLLAVFAMAWRLRGDERWGGADRLTLGAGLFGLAVFAALFFTVGDEPGGSYGLVQRLALSAGGIWVAALTIGLLAIYGRSDDLAVRLVLKLRRLPGGELLVQPGSGAGDL